MATIVAATLGQGAFAAAGGAKLWVARYDRSSAEDRAFAIAARPDGSVVFVTGYAAGFRVDIDTWDYATVAYSASSGAQLWASLYDGPAHRLDIAIAIAVSPDGSRVFVTGDDTGWIKGAIATIAYDAATGKQLWVERYTGPGSGSGAESLAVSPDGSTVFVTGATDGGCCGGEYATVAYTASTGATLWVRRYAGPGNSSVGATSISASPDGSSVFVTGITNTTTLSGRDCVTLAYDASSGATIWKDRYDDPAGRSDDCFYSAADPDGSSVFVAGYVYEGHRPAHYLTLAYRASDGARLWVSGYRDRQTPGSNAASAIVPSPDGSRVFVTGTSDGLTTSADYATVGYDAATGKRLWVSRYNGAASRDDSAVSVAASPDGSKIFVTGDSTGATDVEYATVAYDFSTGGVLWAKTYNRAIGGFSVASAVAASNSEVFVTGVSTGPSGAIRTTDYTTVAYAA